MSIDLIIAVAKTLSAYANHQRQLHEITRNTVVEVIWCYTIDKDGSRVS